MSEKQVTVRIFCEYIGDLAQGIWDYPLYCDKDAGYQYYEEIEGYCTLCAEDVPILNALIHWNIEYDTYYFEFQSKLFNDKVIDKDLFDYETFTERGKRLAFKLKKNHPDWEIRFHDTVGSDIASYMHEEDDVIENFSYWYSVQISNTGDMLLLPLNRRRHPDNPIAWKLYLPNSK